MWSQIFKGLKSPIYAGRVSMLSIQMILCCGFYIFMFMRVIKTVSAPSIIPPSATRLMANQLIPVPLLSTFVVQVVVPCGRVSVVIVTIPGCVDVTVADCVVVRVSVPVDVSDKVSVKVVRFNMVMVAVLVSVVIMDSV